MKLLIVGGGRMGEALAAGLLDAGWMNADELTIVEPVEARRTELSERLCGHHRVGGLRRGRRRSGGGQAGRRGRRLSVRRRPGRAACPVHRSRSHARDTRGRPPPTTAVVRAMPNTPALIGAGVGRGGRGIACGRGRSGVGRGDPGCGRERGPGQRVVARRSDRSVGLRSRRTCS